MRHIFAFCVSAVVGVTIASFTVSAVSAEEDKKLHIYNWSDYIAEDTIENFSEETGIEVVYDVFDSNELLEAKLIAGSSGYDIVVPTSGFMARQIQAGVFQELDKSKLTNYENADQKLLELVSNHDPGNKHSIVYMWGTTGLGYNVDKVQEILGDDAPTDSWDLIFKEEYVSKLAECGVAVLDSPTEMLQAGLNYAGLDPMSTDTEDFEQAMDVIKAIRPHVKYFHSSQYINDLANGEICLAVGWSGDVLQARDRAEEANSGVEIAYVIPKEGALMWFDMMAIPNDAKHPENAHKFLDYVLGAQVAANISNYVYYANGNYASKQYIDPEVTEDPGIYPSEEVIGNLFTSVVYNAREDRVINRLWTSIKTGR